MREVILEASPRQAIRKGVKALRRSGQIPAILYGAGVAPTPIMLEKLQTTKTLYDVSGSTLIDLKVNGDTHKVLVRDVQVDPIRRDVLHIDFLKVAMDVVIRTVVPLELVGEAPATDEKGGVLVIGLDEIEVEALPGDLPERIEVDLGALVEIDQSITVADLQTAEGVRVLNEPDEFIARVIYQEEIVEEEEVEAEAFVPLEAEPELVERGKRHEEGEEEESQSEEE